MSSAFYRTHRPLRFADIRGQVSAVATLQGAVRQDRVAHAFLFTGPRGTGKTSAARIFARTVCCTNLRDKDGRPEPCDACESCHALLENRANDFSEIDAASNRGIEDVRSLREAAAYPPAQLKRRIYVIDECHMLTVEAFNALLKLLEEPPAYCLFILATTELQKVPLTIRSRCQTVVFQSGSPDQIIEKLRAVATAEQMVVDDTTLAVIAAQADGGFRDAETLLEQFANSGSTLSVDTIRQQLGLLTDVAAEGLLDAVLGGDVDATLTQLEAVPERGGAIRQLIELVRGRLRDPTRKAMRPALQTLLEQLFEAYILQRSAPTPRLPLEIALLHVAQAGAAPETTARAPAPRPQPSAVMVATKPKLADPTPVAPVIELRDEPVADVRKAWKTMIDRVCRDYSILGGTLRTAVLHTVAGNTITAHVRFKFHAEKFNEKKNCEIITGILRELTGSNWTIVYEINDNLPRRVTEKKIGTGLEDAAAVFGSAT
jgi:DNA polymerase-3 subunit gamma/tau